jgi:hypothetical protein
MSASRYLGLVAGGAAVGIAAGAAWGWFGSGGYEADDSMIGTAFLCGLLAALVTAVLLPAILQLCWLIKATCRFILLFGF